MSLYHEIHTSERKGFRSCRRRWEWRYRDWYQPVTPIKPLEFGIAYHKAMECLYDPNKWTWDLEVRTELAVQEFEKVCQEQFDAFQNSGYADFNFDEALQDYDERRELGRGMIRYYAQQMVETDEGLTPVQVEISFTVPVTDPETKMQLYCKCRVCWQRYQAHEAPKKETDYESWRGLPVVYKGRVDCLMRDRSGLYWVYDWKTTARLMQDKDRWMAHDDQIASYCWALMVMLGLPIQGFIYHEQLKAFPQPPTENKVVRKGCKFSVSKSQATDYATYAPYVKEHDPQGWASGAYDDFLEWLQSDEGAVFHRRHTVYKTVEELTNVHKDLYLEALDITNPNLNIYPNAGMFNCQWCAYETACIAKRRGDDYQHYLNTMFTREAPYYLQPSTDSRGNQ